MDIEDFKRMMLDAIYDNSNIYHKIVQQRNIYQSGGEDFDHTGSVEYEYDLTENITLVITQNYNELLDFQVIIGRSLYNIYVNEDYWQDDYKDVLRNKEIQWFITNNTFQSLLK